MIGGIVRLGILGLMLGLMFFTGLFVFGLVAVALLVLGGLEWLRYRKILNESVGMAEPAPVIEEEVVFETKVIEADYEEMTRPGKAHHKSGAN